MKQDTAISALKYLKGINSLHADHDPNIKTNTYGEEYVVSIMEAYAGIKVMEAINQERRNLNGSS